MRLNPAHSTAGESACEGVHGSLSSAVLRIEARASPSAVQFVSSPELRFPHRILPQWWSTPSTYLTGIVSFVTAQSFHGTPKIGRYHTDLSAAECIYTRLWAAHDRPISSGGAQGRPISGSSNSSNPAITDTGPARSRPARLSAKDDAKLIFGTIFSLRNMVRKLGGPDDR